METVPEPVPTINKNTLRSRRWRENNRDKVRQYDRDYYHNNDVRRQYKIEYARRRRATLRQQRAETQTQTQAVN
jgi:hypothetical protein